MCIKYDGVRMLIGRTVLSQLRLTTLKTLFETFKALQLSPETHYTYNQQSNVVTFYNGSEIVLKDLAASPSDPNFDSLGSLEITGAFLDEMSQVSQMAYHIIKSRIRYKLNEYNIVGKLFLTCNPANNYLKTEFYTPWVDNQLPEHKKFILATAMDNPHLPQQYIETLQGLPEQQKKRLLMGDWNYLDNADSLFDFDTITASLFKFSPEINGKKYMSVDVARFGSDTSVIVVWVGLCVVDIKEFNKIDTVQLSDEIKVNMKTYGIHPNNIVIDSDGIGSGVADQVRGVNFMNNARPLHNENFQNLKSQCYVRLGEHFKNGTISLNINNPYIIDRLTQELLAIRLKDVDRDGKVTVQPKEELKKVLGHSPDLSDALMMGIYFHIKNNNTTKRYAITSI